MVTRILDDSELYIIDENNGCWNCTCRKNIEGYGYINRDRKQVAVYRYFYMKYKGLIPKGKEVDHLCRNTSCVNPDHLEVVTHAENIRRGKTSKLTMKMVETIRLLWAYKYLNQHELAKLFKISHPRINEIVNYKAWIPDKI